MKSQKPATTTAVLRAMITMTAVGAVIGGIGVGGFLLSTATQAEAAKDNREPDVSAEGEATLSAGDNREAIIFLVVTL